MSDLTDGQWNLSYPGASHYPSCNLTFGTIETGYDLMSPPDINVASINPNDTPMPGEDGTRFGRDYIGNGTITFEVNVDTYYLPEATKQAANYDRVSALRGAWRADAVRLNSGLVATLRTSNAGRQRVVYGRPRRFAATNTTKARQGHTAVIMDFATVDDRFYEDPIQTHIVTFAPSPEGGLTMPLVAPLTSLTTASRTGELVVDGELPTPPVMVVHGPISNPTIAITGLWSITLATVIPAGSYVTIDPRPFARTVLRKDHANLAGALTRSSPKMSNMFVPPGKWEVVLKGTDATGTSYVDFQLRNAYGYL